MSALPLYLLKANGALVLFGVVYGLGLRRLTFYTLNRWFLLFALGFSALYPLVPLSALLGATASGSGAVYQLTPDWAALSGPAPAPAFDWGYWLTLGYWVGVVGFGGRLVGQLGVLAQLHRASRPVVWRGQAFRQVPGAVNPFSFWQTIYLNPEQHPAPELPAILAHEQVHVRQWHTLDVLMAQVQQAFYWFNPGAWLLRRAILENLEFITDRAVLRAGVLDSKAYQYSLVRLSTRAPGSVLASQYTFLSLKNRISMMNKPLSSPLHLAKYVLVLPLAALTMAFTGTRPASPRPSATAATSQTETTQYYLDGQLVTKKVVDELDPKTIASMNVLKGPVATRAFGSTATDAVIIVVTKKNQDSAVVRAFTEQHHLTYSADPASKGLLSDEQGNPPLSDAQLAGKLILIDGQPATPTQLRQLPPSRIATVMVLKGEPAVKKYGDKAAQGVIEVKTK